MAAGALYTFFLLPRRDTKTRHQAPALAESDLVVGIVAAEFIRQRLDAGVGSQVHARAAQARLLHSHHLAHTAHHTGAAQMTGMSSSATACEPRMTTYKRSLDLAAARACVKYSRLSEPI
jgi:hypothetical protein